MKSGHTLRALGRHSVASSDVTVTRWVSVRMSLTSKFQNCFCIAASVYTPHSELNVVASS